MKSFIVLSLVLAPLASPQTTWIVDDDGGPGVDFTDIAPALAAAASGDIVLVADGAYGAPIVLTKGIRLVASADATLASIPGFEMEVRDLPLGQLAVISGLDPCDFQVRHCAGTVVLDGHLERALDGSAPATAGYPISEVSDSSDVRVRGHRLRRITSSRVEQVQGLTATDLEVEAGSKLYLAHGAYEGTQGEDAACFSCLPTPGLTAIRALASHVFLASSWAQGGNGGLSQQGPNHDAFGGYGVMACGGTVRASASIVSGGTYSGFPLPAYELDCGATLTETAPTIDPTLQLIGDPFPGAPVLLRVTGTPGHNVRLLMGRQPILRPIAGSHVDQLVSADRLGALGLIPASGIIDLPVIIPAHWPTATTLFFQTALVAPSGQGTLSNSVPLVLR